MLSSFFVQKLKFKVCHALANFSMCEVLQMCCVKAPEGYGGSLQYEQRLVQVSLDGCK